MMGGLSAGEPAIVPMDVELEEAEVFYYRKISTNCDMIAF